jgi:hypothetical protein
MMPKDREKNNDRQRNAEEPKQQSTSKSHDVLHRRFSVSSLTRETRRGFPGGANSKRRKAPASRATRFVVFSA